MPECGRKLLVTQNLHGWLEMNGRPRTAKMPNPSIAIAVGSYAGSRYLPEYCEMQTPWVNRTGSVLPSNSDLKLTSADSLPGFH